MAENLAKVRKLRLHQFASSVHIEMCCADEYEASVVFDDLEQRMNAGEKICIETCKNGQSEDGKK